MSYLLVIANVRKLWGSCSWFGWEGII